MTPNRNRDRFKRAVMIGLSVFLILNGTVAILQQRWTYGNYWGGQVFAPVAIAFGVLLLYLLVFRYKELKKPRVEKKGRPVRFPADDFRKWE
jgi:hypothetical protein